MSADEPAWVAVVTSVVAVVPVAFGEVELVVPVVLVLAEDGVPDCCGPLGVPRVELERASSS
jgi:hypothetical protein